VKEDSPANLPLRQLPLEIPAQEETIRQLEEALAAEAGLALATGDFAALGEDAWKERRQALASARSRLNRLRVEQPRRWASGFSCLCFVMVGAPLAILWRRADVMSTFGACFIPILLIYYPLLAFGLDRAKAGAMPPYIVWTANIILALAGLWLLRRVIRY
jgi:lipopolysaccharide export system permease protein